MNYFETYTACTIQPKVKRVSEKGEIKDNIKRYIELIDAAPGYNIAMKRSSPKGYHSYAPTKLVSFPEFYLTGAPGRTGDFERIKRDMLIEIPGEETDLLAEKCEQHDLYLVGASLELDPEWKDRFFNTAYIISPEKKVIHKYRKFMVATFADLELSPHDMLDLYMEKYGKRKTVLETCFPVTDTPIGKLGTFICMDGNYPEVTRALALNGAEVLIRPTAWPEPMVSSPFNTWEIQNRMRAYENMSYLVAPTIGFNVSFDKTECNWPGGSIIVDYNGVILAHTNYPGETIIGATIRLRDLRTRRLDFGRNFLPLIRSEVFKEIYEEPIYPINQFLKSPVTKIEEGYRRAPLKVIDKFIEKGIYTKP